MTSNEESLGVRSEFTVRGLRNGSLVHVHWGNGEITGDPPTVDLVLVAAELAALGGSDRMAARAGIGISNPTPLADAVTAVTLVASVIDRVTEVVPESLRSAAGLD